MSYSYPNLLKNFLYTCEILLQVHVFAGICPADSSTETLLSRSTGTLLDSSTATLSDSSMETLSDSSTETLSGNETC